MHGRGVLITGGTSGIGYAVAKRFLELGDRLVITGRDYPKLQEAAAELSSAGATVHPELASLADPNSIDRLVQATIGALGRVDVLINNAGMAVEAPFLDTTDDLWEEHFAVNVSGPFRLSRAIARIMVNSGDSGGVIVNTSSIDAVASERGLCAYAATKAALESLTRSMALELAAAGVRVNCVSPGWIRTPIYTRGGADPHAVESYMAEVVQHVPMGRTATPDEIAGVFTFLASPDAGYITGAVIVADGGRLAC